nr:NADH dehydrogenase subunit 5 [Raillietina sp. HL-2022]
MSNSVFCFLFVLIIVIVCFFSWTVADSWIDVNLISSYNWNWLACFSLDYVVLFVSLMLVVCFIYVLYYTGHYFNGGEGVVSLTQMICLFVGVMFLLTCTGDFLSTLILWEYLGVVSFFLILFYGSYLSLRSSIVTLVSSRFGDVSLFILIACSYFLFDSIFISAFLFFFIIFTKSAGFPFISWLLEAMRAPTPVSSLVHSSTLVAAGVWFSMRYNLLEFFSNIFYFNIFLVATIFISGICCFFFNDLKKIVALSTCNNISWCVLYLILGDVSLALFQLASHGVAKCILFTLVGDVMSGSGGSQASNCIYSPYFYGNWGIFTIFAVVLGLSGAPFIGVFFTKHIMLTTFNSVWNLFFLIVIMMCVFLSYFYSFRLCSVVLNTKSSSPVGVFFCFDSWMVGYSWLFINFFMGGFIVEYYKLSSFNSLMLIVFQVISCLIAIFAYHNNSFSNWSSTLFGCDNIVELFYHFVYQSVNALTLYIYRWDNYAIYLFSGIGSSIIDIHKEEILNLLIYSMYFFLVWFIILY